LGALTGLLVGLTTASVTTTVLASVLAVATAFIGLAGKAKFLDGLVNHARVASFVGASLPAPSVLSKELNCHDNEGPP
jgi:hypothetical protein